MSESETVTTGEIVKHICINLRAKVVETVPAECSRHGGHARISHPEWDRPRIALPENLCPVDEPVVSSSEVDVSGPQAVGGGRK